MDLNQIEPAPLPPKNAASPVAEQSSTGVPILVGPDGQGQALTRVSLTPRGQGEFDEAWLQRVIHDNPICLPIQEIEPGLDYFSAICRELPTPHGSVDNLLMTGRGDIAIVETKLFRNPEARRVVLAQVLDYAASLFAMTYAEFERAVLASTFAPAPKPPSLYESLPDGDKLPEASFIDAVQQNLRRGRALLLVAGDGIRNDAERLLSDLQGYARFGFTLALVELAVFRMPTGGFLIRPRTLAKTAITQRTIVEVSGGGIVAVREEHPVVPDTLSTNSYWDSLEAKTAGARAALERLISMSAPLGVYPEMLGSLNLKWRRPSDGKPINLGYIRKGGNVWFEASSWFVPKELALRYVEEIAALFDAQVQPISEASKDGPTVFRAGRPITLSAMIERLERWPEVMKRFIDAVAASDAENES